MFGLQDFTFNVLTNHPWLVALGLAVLTGLSVFLYRRTTPPLPLSKRLLLGALRVLAVLALFAALFEPVISFSREFERKPRVSMLVDGSLSMQREENGKSRTQRVDSLQSSPAYNRLTSSTDFESWYFASEVQPNQDELNRDKTALGDAIRELERRQLDNPADFWLLLSDGRSNAGRIPAEAARGLDQPVFVVDMAVGGGAFDVALDDIEFNPVQFVGQEALFNVRLGWRGADNEDVLVQLLDGTNVVDERRFKLTQADGFGEVELTWVPPEPGQRLLKVRVPSLENEETESNNERTLAVKVLKSRLAVMVVSPEPDYEVGFLTRFLRQSDKYDVELVVTGPNAGNLRGSLPARQTELNRYDLVVLHDPDPAMLSERQDIIKTYLSDRGGAIWVLMGNQFAGRGPVGWFNELLPFAQPNKAAVRYMDFRAEPAEGNLFHPAVRLADDRTSIRETWSNLPPFEALVPAPQIDPNGVVLAWASGPRIGAQNLPVLGYKRFGPGKLVASAAQPFWHWGFVNLGFGEDAKPYTDFLEGVVSWLTIPEDFDPIRISPDKEVFSRGEPVSFEGYAFDQGFRPIPGVTGTVRLEKADADESFETDLIDRGQGKFTAEFTGIAPGTYRWEAEFEKGGQVLKRVDGEVLVETFSLEEFDQSGDPNTLRAIARASGGSYFTFSQFDDAVASAPMAIVTESEKTELSVWGQTWLLLIFIGLLALEWLLRKTNHLV